MGQEGPRPPELFLAVLRYTTKDFEEYAHILDRPRASALNGIPSPLPDRRPPLGHTGGLQLHLQRLSRIPADRQPARLRVGSDDSLQPQLRPADRRREDVGSGPACRHAEPLEAEGDEVDVLRRDAVLYHHDVAVHSEGQPGVRLVRAEVQPPFPAELRVLRGEERRGGRLLPKRGPSRGGDEPLRRGEKELGGGRDFGRGRRRPGAVRQEARVLDQGRRRVTGDGRRSIRSVLQHRVRPGLELPGPQGCCVGNVVGRFGRDHSEHTEHGRYGRLGDRVRAQRGRGRSGLK
mmetsp:Transcript_10112/g.23655  ORF Transcript_10112/g.23655 Transcript_10112/m.23655 type:complete len:291 (+) Transcript_10112:679-1551(+)